MKLIIKYTTIVFIALKAKTKAFMNQVKNEWAGIHDILDDYYKGQYNEK